MSHPTGDALEPHRSGDALEPHRSWRRFVNVLLRRAALGAAYAAGGLIITVGGEWVISRMM
ncbi:hypothetical protein ACIBLA_27140 [Streptomyces sp. NPDC050433]|uniref:hypothetical protein n=1 Tax=Streptomyces sp. NPDC050433 TaxID=3365615 RepID=UPI0037925B92